MKLQKIYSQGKILNSSLYDELKALDARVFFGCADEFKENRDWWVIMSGNRIVAYCGCLYSEGVCIFVRAWVHAEYRGQGIQRRMIKIRIKAARRACETVITYTTADNYPSANNLIKCGFLLYHPAYNYAGTEMIYFRKVIK